MESQPSSAAVKGASNEASAAKQPESAVSPRQQAIEEEMNLLQQLSRAEDIRVNLAKAVDDFHNDIKGMKETSIKLTEMTGDDNQVGELQTYLASLNDAIKQGEKTESILTCFVDVVNNLFGTSIKALQDGEVDQAKVDLCHSELNQLKNVNIELQRNCAALDEKSKAVQASHTRLKKKLAQRESKLKSIRLGLIVSGTALAVGSVIGVGLVVGLGIVLVKCLSKEEAIGFLNEGAKSKEAKSAAMSFGSHIYKWVTEWFSDFKSVRSKLSTARKYENELKLAASTDELIAAIQATISEAENCYDKLNKRLAEREKQIETQRENELLKERIERLEQELKGKLSS